MRFYTNVQMVGDQMLVRGYENGKRYMNREVFNPTLFVSAKNKKSKYRTIEGEPVEPVRPGTIRETRDFMKKYDNVDGFNIYGFERFIYQYISDHYPDEHIEFDISKINLVTIDIETKSEYGFLTFEMGVRSYFLLITKILTPNRSFLRVLDLSTINKRTLTIVSFLMSIQC